MIPKTIYLKSTQTQSRIWPVHFLADVELKLHPVRNEIGFKQPFDKGRSGAGLARSRSHLHQQLAPAIHDFLAQGC